MATFDPGGRTTQSYPRPERSWHRLSSPPRLPAALDCCCCCCLTVAMMGQLTTMPEGLRAGVASGFMGSREDTLPAAARALTAATEVWRSPACSTVQTKGETGVRLDSTASNSWTVLDVQNDTRSSASGAQRGVYASSTQGCASLAQPTQPNPPTHSRPHPPGCPTHFARLTAHSGEYAGLLGVFAAMLRGPRPSLSALPSP